MNSHKSLRKLFPISIPVSVWLLEPIIYISPQDLILASEHFIMAGPDREQICKAIECTPRLQLTPLLTNNRVIVDLVSGILMSLAGRTPITIFVWKFVEQDVSDVCIYVTFYCINKSSYQYPATVVNINNQPFTQE